MSSVVEIVGFDGDQVLTSEVFATAAGTTRAVPAAAVSADRAAVLTAAGWDARTLNGHPRPVRGGHPGHLVDVGSLTSGAVL